MTTGMSTGWVIILVILIVLFLVAGLWAFRTPRHSSTEAKRELGLIPDAEETEDAEDTTAGEAVGESTVSEAAGEDEEPDSENT